uniref:Rapunzel 2 n=1 Tax=Iconisemion striatum TaxID=60296 RepID=A0A1A7Y393_9TELE
MAGGQDIKGTAVKVLGLMEKVTSFASSIDPIFGVVSSLVKVARKGLEDDKTHPLDKDFQEIHTKLESISEKNRLILNDILVKEVIENYGKYEEYIKHQYSSFIQMVAKVKKNPDDAKRYMEAFEKIYERDKSDLSLDVLYNGVMGKSGLFGRPVLMVYLQSCDGDRKTMEHICSHFINLFHIGLIALMGYTAVTEDDEDEVKEKWSTRVMDIQTAMEDVLGKCKDPSS